MSAEPICLGFPGQDLTFQTVDFDSTKGLLRRKLSNDRIQFVRIVGLCMCFCCLQKMVYSLTPRNAGSLVGSSSQCTKTSKVVPATPSTQEVFSSKSPIISTSLEIGPSIMHHLSDIRVIMRKITPGRNCREVLKAAII